MSASTPASAPGRRPRVASVDVLRALAMIVMVLDHTRDFAHADSFLFDPTDLGRTTPAIFLTRWVTHFVAPVFVLLAGVAARLQRLGGRGRGELARYLVVRGLWLIALELTVVRVGLWFNVDPAFLGMLQVIWVLGVSMVVLAGLVFLPDWLIAAFGLLLIVGHNALDGISVPADLELPWSILHEQANLAIVSPGPPDLFILYPLVPWVGVMALGYVLGRLYGPSPATRRAWLVGLGLATTAVWLVLRALNGYGDPVAWAAAADPVQRLLSFLNAEKYPPSLIFLAMTLGPALLLLALLDRLDPGRSPAAPDSTATRGLALRAWHGLAVLGSVPLFFYLAQWYVAHALAVIAELAAGQDVAWQFLAPPDRFAAIPPGAGFELPVVYALWLGAIVILWPLATRYAELRRRRGGVLRYL